MCFDRNILAYFDPAFKLHIWDVFNSFECFDINLVHLQKRLWECFYPIFSKRMSGAEVVDSKQLKRFGIINRGWLHSRKAMVLNIHFSLSSLYWVLWPKTVGMDLLIDEIVKWCHLTCKVSVRFRIPIPAFLFKCYEVEAEISLLLHRKRCLFSPFIDLWFVSFYDVISNSCFISPKTEIQKHIWHPTFYL